MKSEEIERLFRDKLDKLEHVPGVEWSDESTWNNLSKGIKGGWNNLYAWILFVCILLSAYSFFVKINRQEELVINDRTATSLMVKSLKKDSVRSVLNPSAKFKKRRVNDKELKVCPVMHSDTFHTKPSNTDTLLKNELSNDKGERNKAKKKLFNRNMLVKNQFNRDDFKFTLPQTSYLKLKVDNQFNFPNLIKSIKAEKSEEGNLYYFYEYNKSYSPPYYRNNNPNNLHNNTFTITNFKK